MGSISRDIYTLSARRVAAIDIVYGSAVPIHFNMMDITIPDGAAVVFYAQQQDGPVYRADGWKADNTAGFTPPEGFFKLGYNLLQVEINGKIIPVAIDVKCHERLSGAGSEATPEQVRPLVEQALSAAREAVASKIAAAGSAQAAKGSQDAAAGSAQAALNSQNAAAGSAEAAAGSAGAAAGSAQEALKSKNAAAGSAQAAQEALEKTQEISVNPAYIGDNGNWFVWNTAQDSYVDSGVKAQGPQGVPGTGNVSSVCGVIPGDDGNVALTAENVGAVAENDLLSKTYPVGAIYLSASSTSPAELFGGTWERLKDRFLLAAGDSYTAGSTGGEAEHKLTVDEMPSHNHTLKNRMNASTGGYWNAPPTSSDTGTEQTGVSSIVNYTGGDQPHNNMPPYLAVYMWKRVA